MNRVEKSYWAYQGSAYQAPTYAFNNYDDALEHAITHREFEGMCKDQAIDHEEQLIFNIREQDVPGLGKVEFIGKEAA